MEIDPGTIETTQLHSYMLGAVVPRPIAFASTIDKNGNINLSPFSFFNAFSSNPPILVFSASRRVRDNTTKHTLENISEHPEVVINIVDHSIVQQMSLSSTEYPKGINEFQKSGLTQHPSKTVQPPRVGESKAVFECKVNEVIALGKEGGAGHLIICEVKWVFINEVILDENGKIDPFKLDAVGRMGGDWYVRAAGSALFEVQKPNRNMGIGFDKIPKNIRNSDILSGNALGRLGNIERLPDVDEIEKFAEEPEVSAILASFSDNPDSRQLELHKLALTFLEEGDINKAWKTLLQP